MPVRAGAVTMHCTTGWHMHAPLTVNFLGLLLLSSHSRHHPVGEVHLAVLRRLRNETARTLDFDPYGTAMSEAKAYEQ
jgi:hypothetical protein